MSAITACLLSEEQKGHLKAELQNLRRKGALRPSADWDSTGPDPDRSCGRCRVELGRVINRGAYCRACRLKVCKGCREYSFRTTDWVCTVCHKHMEIQTASGEWMNEFVRRPSRRRDNRVYVPAADIIKRTIRRSWTISNPTVPRWSSQRGSVEFRPYNSLPRGQDITDYPSLTMYQTNIDKNQSNQTTTEPIGDKQNKDETAPKGRINPLIKYANLGAGGGGSKTKSKRRNKEKISGDNETGRRHLEDFLDKERGEKRVSFDTDALKKSTQQDTKENKDKDKIEAPILRTNSLSISDQSTKKILPMRNSSCRGNFTASLCNNSNTDATAKKDNDTTIIIINNNNNNNNSNNIGSGNKIASSSTVSTTTATTTGGGNQPLPDRLQYAKGEEIAAPPVVELCDIEPLSGTVFRKVTVRRQRRHDNSNNNNNSNNTNINNTTGGNSLASGRKLPPPVVAATAAVDINNGWRRTTCPPTNPTDNLDFFDMLIPEGDDYKLVFISSDSSSKEEDVDDNDSSSASSFPIDDCDWDYFEPGAASSAAATSARVVNWSPFGSPRVLRRRIDVDDEIDGRDAPPPPPSPATLLQTSECHVHNPNKCNSCGGCSGTAQFIPIPVPVPIPFPVPTLWPQDAGGSLMLYSPSSGSPTSVDLSRLKLPRLWPGLWQQSDLLQQYQKLRHQDTVDQVKIKNSEELKELPKINFDKEDSKGGKKKQRIKRRSKSNPDNNTDFAISWKAKERKMDANEEAQSRLTEGTTTETCDDSKSSGDTNNTNQDRPVDEDQDPNSSSKDSNENKTEETYSEQTTSTVDQDLPLTGYLDCENRPLSSSNSSSSSSSSEDNSENTSGNESKPRRKKIKRFYNINGPKNDRASDDALPSSNISSENEDKCPNEESSSVREEVSSSGSSADTDTDDTGYDKKSKRFARIFVVNKNLSSSSDEDGSMKSSSSSSEETSDNDTDTEMDCTVILTSVKSLDEQTSLDELDQSEEGGDNEEIVLLSFKKSDDQIEETQKENKQRSMAATTSESLLLSSPGLSDVSAESLNSSDVEEHNEEAIYNQNKIDLNSLDKSNETKEETAPIAGKKRRKKGRKNKKSKINNQQVSNQSQNKEIEEEKLNDDFKKITEEFLLTEKKCQEKYEKKVQKDKNIPVPKEEIHENAATSSKKYGKKKNRNKKDKNKKEDKNLSENTATDVKVKEETRQNEEAKPLTSQEINKDHQNEENLEDSKKGIEKNEVNIKPESEDEKSLNPSEEQEKSLKDPQEEKKVGKKQSKKSKNKKCKVQSKEPNEKTQNKEETNEDNETQNISLASLPNIESSLPRNENKEEVPDKDSELNKVKSISLSQITEDKSSKNKKSRKQWVKMERKEQSKSVFKNKIIDNSTSTIETEASTSKKEETQLNLKDDLKKQQNNSTEWNNDSINSQSSGSTTINTDVGSFEPVTSLPGANRSVDAKKTAIEIIKEHATESGTNIVPSGTAVLQPSMGKDKASASAGVLNASLESLLTTSTSGTTSTTSTSSSSTISNESNAINNNSVSSLEPDVAVSTSLVGSGGNVAGAAAVTAQRYYKSTVMIRQQEDNTVLGEQVRKCSESSNGTINNDDANIEDGGTGGGSQVNIIATDTTTVINDDDNNVIVRHTNSNQQVQQQHEESSTETESKVLPDEPMAPEENVTIVTGADTLSAFEEGLADDDSWVDGNLSNDDDDDFNSDASDDSSSGEEITLTCSAAIDHEDELRGYHRQAIDFTLHTIVEESCEESEVEPSSLKSNNAKEQRLSATELEKYFFFGLGNGEISQNAQEEVFSETSSIYSENMDSLGNEEQNDNPSDPAELASSRLEKYFLSGFMGFKERRDSDGSVGSDSEGRPSPEQRRKRLVRARGSGRSHSSSLDNLIANPDLAESGENLNSEISSGDSSDSETCDELNFDKDGQFDTVKRCSKQKQSKKSAKNYEEKAEFELSESDERNKTPQPDMPSTNSTTSNTTNLSSKNQSRDSGFVGSSDDLLKTDEAKESRKVNLEEIIKPSNPPPVSLTRKDSFNNWSSDEETNLMMSKMRQFFKSMIQANSKPSTPNLNKPSATTSTSPKVKKRFKPPQLVYFENELTRLMKTVPGIRDDQVREIVEYLSSEDTWSDSYDSSDYTSSDLEGTSTKSALQQQISDSCKQIINKFDNNIDDEGDEGDGGILDENHSRETAFVYQKLVASFEKIATDDLDKNMQNMQQNSPPLIAKVMHHIGSRLVALMHEVSSGESLASNSPKRFYHHRRLQPKISNSTTSTEDDNDSVSDSNLDDLRLDLNYLPRSRSHDLLLEGKSVLQSDLPRNLHQSSSGVSDIAEEREQSDCERFSWRGSFESALLATDSRNKLTMLENSTSSVAAKRRSAGDLLFTQKSLSREQLDRVRSCGSIGGASSEDKLWKTRSNRRRSSVPDAACNSEASNDGGDEEDDDLESRLTLPRTLQSTSSNTTNSLPRLPVVSSSAGMSKSQSMYHFLPQNIMNAKSARYRPPGFSRLTAMVPKRAVSAPGLQPSGHQRRSGTGANGRRSQPIVPSDDVSISEAHSSPMLASRSNSKSASPSPVAHSSRRTTSAGVSTQSNSQSSEWQIANDEDVLLDRLVGLQRTSLSSLGLRSDSMASVYSGAGEGRYGTVAVRGQVEFGLQYNYKAGALEILIKQCRDLAPVDIKRNRSDPYVKVYLLPDKSKSGKRKTKVKKHTLNPVFDECLKFHISLNGLETRTLWLTVWHSDMFGRNDFLGEVMMTLENKVFDDPTPKWYNLQERTEPFDDMLSFKGDIIVCLKFVPPDMTVPKKGKRSRGTLHVLVKEAKSLTAVKANGTSDPFCKSYLLPDKGRSSKQKTPVAKKTVNPIWNHTFIYDDVTLQELAERCLELTVWDHDRLASNEFLGGVRFSLGTGKHYGKSVDWMDATGKELSLWKSMLERPNFWVEGCLSLRPSLDLRQN